MGSVATPDRLAIDSNCLIYYVEGASDRAEWLDLNVFGPAMNREIELVFSVLALTEAFVKPLANGDEDGMIEFSSALDALANLELIDVTRSIAMQAASVRATSGCTVADAIHAATAEQSVAGGFLTNDKRLRTLKLRCPVLILDDLVRRK